jgi:hypothetical protein
MADMICQKVYEFVMSIFNVLSNHDFESRGDLEIIDIDLAETLFIEIRKPRGRNIIVGVIYRPPDRNLDLFLQQFNELMSKISRENKICYIMGDFNLNLMNHQSSPKTGEFLDSIFKYVSSTDISSN